MLYKIIFWTEKGKMEEYAECIDMMITYTDNRQLQEKLYQIANFLHKLESFIGKEK